MPIRADLHNPNQEGYQQHATHKPVNDIHAR